ncbi:MAG TPA: tetratricopeptide repeat protein [Bryobacteraceae bacterium]|nr:tetratricopeptide repeat protein [Bryobacteraceae bacterium]
MSRIRFACSIVAVLACAALATMPVLADSWEDCKQTDDPDLAIESCTTVLATAQGDQVIQGNFLRAIAYFGKHDYYHAVKDFSVVISLRPVQVAYIYRGLAYENQMADDPSFADRAIADLGEATSLQPGVDDKTKAQFWLAYQTRAIANLKKGDDAQALADEDVAIQLNPDKAVAIKAYVAQAYKQRAWQNLADGQYDGAVSNLQQAIELDPTTADKLTPYLTEAQSRHPGPYSAIVRGDQHQEDQDYELAVNDYTEAIQANPNLADAHLYRGYAYRALDRSEDARADFDEAIRLDPNGWLGFYALGQVYQSMEQFDKAATNFDQASGIIERVQDLGYEYEKARIDDARKALKFSITLQDHWMSYLREIQTANTYPNWSSAPYDLYVKHHSLQNVAKPMQTRTAPPTRSAVPRSPKRSAAGPEWGLWVLGLFGLLVVPGTGWGAVILHRRHKASCASEPGASGC